MFRSKFAHSVNTLIYQTHRVATNTGTRHGAHYLCTLMLLSSLLLGMVCVKQFNTVLALITPEAVHYTLKQIPDFSMQSTSFKTRSQGFSIRGPRQHPVLTYIPDLTISKATKILNHNPYQILLGPNFWTTSPQTIDPTLTDAINTETLEAQSFASLVAFVNAMQATKAPSATDKVLSKGFTYSKDKHYEAFYTYILDTVHYFQSNTAKLILWSTLFACLAQLGIHMPIFLGYFLVCCLLPFLSPQRFVVLSMYKRFHLSCFALCVPCLTACFLSLALVFGTMSVSYNNLLYLNASIGFAVIVLSLKNSSTINTQFATL